MCIRDRGYITQIQYREPEYSPDDPPTLTTRDYRTGFFDSYMRVTAKVDFKYLDPDDMVGHRCLIIGHPDEWVIESFKSLFDTTYLVTFRQEKTEYELPTYTEPTPSTDDPISDELAQKPIYSPNPLGGDDA